MGKGMAVNTHKKTFWCKILKHSCLLIVYDRLCTGTSQKTTDLWEQKFANGSYQYKNDHGLFRKEIKEANSNNVYCSFKLIFF